MTPAVKLLQILDWDSPRQKARMREELAAGLLQPQAAIAHIQHKAVLFAVNLYITLDAFVHYAVHHGLIRGKPVIGADFRAQGQAQSVHIADNARLIPCLACQPSSHATFPLLQLSHARLPPVLAI